MSRLKMYTAAFTVPLKICPKPLPWQIRISYWIIQEKILSVQNDSNAPGGILRPTTWRRNAMKPRSRGEREGR